MMTIERAIATVANHQGHSREVILEAAQVLRLHVPTSHGFSEGKVSKLDQSRDNLFGAMADALEITLRKVSKMWPEDGPAVIVIDNLKNCRILFDAARLTGP